MDARFLHPPRNAGPHCHAPTVMRAPDGDLVAAWYCYPEDESRDGVIVTSRLAASARAWTSATIVALNTRRSAGNPVLFADPTGLVHLLYVVLEGSYWNAARIFGLVSQDGGLTWGAPEPAYAATGTMIRHPPLAHPDGRLLLPAYDERTRRSVLLESREPWTHWHEAVCFEGDDLIHPVVLGDASGNPTALFRPAGDRRRVYRSISSDAGRTWSSPIITSLPSPPSGIAACTVGDAIVAVYNHTEEHRRTPLSAAWSLDRGVSWSEPVHLDDAPVEVSYPTVIATSDRRIEVLFSYDRRSIKHCAVELETLR